jgi:uncharacterized membrane protein
MMARPARPAPRTDLDRTIARILTIGTYLSVGLLAIGVALMALNGISPLATAPPLDPALLLAQIRAADPVGFLWLGLIVVIATPIARVTASLVGYARDGERAMVLVSIAILVVIATSVALAVGLGG